MGSESHASNDDVEMRNLNGSRSAEQCFRGVLRSSLVGVFVSLSPVRAASSMAPPPFAGPLGDKLLSFAKVHVQSMLVDKCISDGLQESFVSPGCCDADLRSVMRLL